mgnify:FL=1
MPRYTVYRNPERGGYLLDLQADINSHFSTRVVAPCLFWTRSPYSPRA